MCIYIYIYIYTHMYIYKIDIHTYTHIHTYIYITANPRTNIVDFGGFDSSTTLILRGGIPRPTGDSLESLTQAMLVGVMLVGRLGVDKLIELNTKT